MGEERQIKRPPPLSDEFKAEVKKQELCDETFEGNVLTDRELRALDVPKIEWLIPNLMTFPSLMVIAGRPMSYKTAFAQWIARRIAAGLPLFDISDELPLHGLKKDRYPPRKVLFVEEEMSKRQMKQRSNTMKTFNEDNLYWMISKGFKFSSEKWIQGLKDFIRENEIDCVFFDPFSSVSGLADESNNSEAAVLMDNIRHTLIQTEDSPCSVVLIHHPAKGEKGDAIRGAGDILGKMDQAICLEPQDRGREGIHVKWIKHRDIMDTPSDFKIELRDMDDSVEKEFAYVGILKEEGSEEKKDKVRIELIRIIKNCKKLNMTRQNIANMLGLDNTGTKFRGLWDEGKNR